MVHSKLLLPSYFKQIGLILLIPAVVLGVLALHQEFTFDFLATAERPASLDGIFTDHNLTNEFAGILVLLSLVFIGFSKLRKEDERTIKLRLDALLFSFYVYIAALIMLFLVIYGANFTLALVYCMYLPLIIYIIRFYLYIWRS